MAITNVIVNINRALIRSKIETAYNLSLGDAKREVKVPRRSGRLAKSLRTTKRGRFVARLSANTAYAKARERGAYIEAKTPKRLRFMVEGQWKSPRAVRQRAQPYLKPVGPVWRSRLMPRRLREVF